MKNEKNKRSNQKGSALIFVLVIMVVVTVVCLSLLLVSSTLIQSVQNQKAYTQSREAAITLSREIENELTIPAFATKEAEVKAETDSDNKYDLWFYLRYNIWQDNWPYYNTDKRGHDESYAYRYFKLESNSVDSEAASAAKDVSIVMYWERENGDEHDVANGTPLIVQVTCKVGDQSCTITSTYELTEADAAYSDAASFKDHVPVSREIDPRAQIACNEEYAWSWALSERE